MTRLLVLPGIGDIYWIAVALDGFIAKHKLENVSVAVWDFDGRRRSLEFVERLPNVSSAGYFRKPPHPFKLPAFRQTYYTGETSIVPGLFGFDYYLAVNGALRTGQTIEQAMGVPCNFYPDFRQTPEEIAATTRFRADYGPYVVCHFSDYGIFRRWAASWAAPEIAILLNRLHNATGYRFLLTGCEWDRSYSQAIAGLASPLAVADITGATLPDDFFGMLRGAQGVLGWCGGNTILATALRIPTLMGWSNEEFPDERFFANACPPDALGTHYLPIVVERTRPLEIEKAFLDLLARHPERRGGA